MLNRIMLIGNIGKDPEMVITPDGTQVTKFSVATNRKVKGETETDWFNVVTFGKLAAICEQYLHSGSKVYIEGRLQQRKYTDKQGQARVSVEVVANDMKMLDSKPQEDNEYDL